jgi:hypothetical protein
VTEKYPYDHGVCPVSEAGIPSRRRACLEAGQGQGVHMDTRRLNDTEPLSLVGYTFGADATRYPLPR